MACGTCGGNHSSGCCNPCNSVSVTNTAACESLPSQIENFTKQFFGAVVKTEINGVVEWSLPCSLDIGLPNNPRDAGEGLACYFLRLFEEGIIGLTGPKGDPGTNGTAGRNAYTVTVASFVQPTLANPNVQVLTSYNPAILEELYVFIATSGWYVVNQTDSSGTLFLTLVKSVSNPPVVVTAGKLVVPSGFPGASVQGPQGVQGPKGDDGDPAEAFTTNNDMFFVNSGTDYNIQVTYAAVTYTSSTPSVLLTAVGRYLVTAVCGVVGLATVALTDKVTFKLRNTTISGDFDGSEKGITNLAVDEEKQVVINVIVETDAVNQTLALFAKATTANKIASVANATTITFVRIE